MIHLSVYCARRLNYFDLQNSVTILRTIHDLMWIVDVTPPVAKRSSLTNTAVVLTVERNQINSLMMWLSHAVVMAAAVVLFAVAVLSLSYLLN